MLFLGLYAVAMCFFLLVFITILFIKKDIKKSNKKSAYFLFFIHFSLPFTVVSWYNRKEVYER